MCQSSRMYYTHAWLDFVTLRSVFVARRLNGGDYTLQVQIAQSDCTPGNFRTDTATTPRQLMYLHYSLRPNHHSHFVAIDITLRLFAANVVSLIRIYVSNDFRCQSHIFRILLHYNAITEINFEFCSPRDGNDILRERVVTSRANHSQRIISVPRNRIK